MKLYGSYASPFVRHVRIVLLETGLACEFIETDQTGSAAQSPTQRVPFLQDGDIFLTDSASIIKYLRERVGQDYCKTAKELDELCLVSTLMDATVNLFFIKRDGVDISGIPYLQRQAARIHTTLKVLFHRMGRQCENGLAVITATQFFNSLIAVHQRHLDIH